jgi:hypothetical protein
MKRIFALALVLVFVAGFFAIPTPAAATGKPPKPQPPVMVEVCYQKLVPVHEDHRFDFKKPKFEWVWATIMVPEKQVDWWLKILHNAQVIPTGSACPPVPAPGPGAVTFGFTIRVSGVPDDVNDVTWMYVCGGQYPVADGSGIVHSAVKVETDPGEPDTGQRVADLGAILSYPDLACYKASAGAWKTVVGSGTWVPN